MRKTVIMLGAVLFLLFVPAGCATESYSISTLGIRWSISTISVYVPSSPSTQTIIDAVNIWNQAEAWFGQKYLNGTTSLYHLTPSSSPKGSDVIVSFSSNSSEWVDYPLLRVLGNTIVSANLTFYVRNLDESGAIAVFGTILGLNTTSVTEDVMSPLRSEHLLPSTLDLYAVSVLFLGQTPTQVTLPNSIPYAHVPQNAVPEFPVMSVVLVVVLVTILAVSVGHRLKRKSLP